MVNDNHKASHSVQVWFVWFMFFWSATLWLISRTTDVAFIDLTCRRLGEQGVSQLICRRVRHPEIRNVSNKHGMSSNQHLGVYQHGDGLMILKIWLKITFSHLGYPLGNKHSYWKWWFIVDSPIKGLTPGCRRPPVKGGCFLRFLSLGQAMFWGAGRQFWDLATRWSGSVTFQGPANNALKCYRNNMWAADGWAGKEFWDLAKSWNCSGYFYTFGGPGRPRLGRGQRMKDGDFP